MIFKCSWKSWEVGLEFFFQMVDVEKMQKKKKLLFHEGKNKIKGATQVSGHSLKISFLYV
jgi:hypothetical protein